MTFIPPKQKLVEIVSDVIAHRDKPKAQHRPPSDIASSPRDTGWWILIRVAARRPLIFVAGVASLIYLFVHVLAGVARLISEWV